MEHVNLQSACSAAVFDGRITTDQQNQLTQFANDLNTKPVSAINWQNVITNILPIIGAVFPQGSIIIATIQTIFGFLKPTPAPTPTPVPVPTPTPINTVWAQLLAVLQSLLNGGTLPVPGPVPLPTPKA